MTQTQIIPESLLPYFEKSNLEFVPYREEGRYTYSGVRVASDYNDDAHYYYEEEAHFYCDLAFDQYGVGLKIILVDRRNPALSKELLDKANSVLSQAGAMHKEVSQGDKEHFPRLLWIEISRDYVEFNYVSSTVNATWEEEFFLRDGKWQTWRTALPFRNFLAIDVDYGESSARVAGVEFESWRDSSEQASYISSVTGIEPYESGNFYRRELPCILHLLEEHRLKPDLIVVDGFVWLDGSMEPGLGAYLYEALDRKTPVVGVAKKPFAKISTDFEVMRGKSKKPLYVTSVGFCPHSACNEVKYMAGEHRIPTLLKRVDTLCRGLIQARQI